MITNATSQITSRTKNSRGPVFHERKTDVMTSRSGERRVADPAHDINLRYGAERPRVVTFTQHIPENRTSRLWAPTRLYKRVYNLQLSPGLLSNALGGQAGQ
jgi:hypothetical protein